jgi:riboflavin synthase
MFTGIVEDLGEVEAIEHAGDSARIFVRSGAVTEDAHPGDSIAVNGVCLTVTGLITGQAGIGAPVSPTGTGAAALPRPRGFAADVIGETLKRSNLDVVAPGSKVNLERPVRLQDRLGGHLVQGHVDDTATIIGRQPREQWEVVRISLPPGLDRYVVHKGFIAVDGISLTVSGIGGGIAAGGTTPAKEHEWFEVSVIPETLKRTTLGFKQPGELVNLEVDVIAKYVEKLTGGAR